MEQRRNESTQGKQKLEETFFELITAKERQEVINWLESQKGEVKNEEYIKIMKEALEVVTYDYWIATIEPSIENEKICYQEGKKVATSIVAKEWQILCQEYNPGRGSRMASLYELFIWYTLRVAKGYWTYEEFMQNSDRLGNYNGSNVRYSKKDPKHYKSGLECAICM